MQDAVTHAEIVPILLSVIGFLLIALVSLYARGLEKRVTAVEEGLEGKQDKEDCVALHALVERDMTEGDSTFAALIDAVNELSINMYEVAMGVNALLGDAGKATISVERPKAITVVRSKVAGK